MDRVTWPHRFLVRFLALFGHVPFSVHHRAVEIEAMLVKEACKPPVYAIKGITFCCLDFTDRLAAVQLQF